MATELDSKDLTDGHTLRILKDDEGVECLVLGGKSVKGGEVYGGEWRGEAAKEAGYIRRLFNEIDSAEEFTRRSVEFRDRIQDLVDNQAKK